MGEGRCRHDRGSVLMLMPAAVLVVLVLGAIAVDLSVVHLGEREVGAAASAAANDAVASAVSEADLYSGGRFSLDSTEVHDVVLTSLAAQDFSGRDLRLASPPVLTDSDGDGGADTVQITVTMQVDYVFAAGIPQAAEGTTVQATAEATAVRQ